jgi:4-amino-4-deoxy-L-arabinose transferase-like glycosyltransferase
MYGKLLLEGKTPYVDFYEQKLPGIFYAYAFIQMFVGDSVKGMHTGFIFINLITIVCLYFAGKKLFSELTGLIAAVSYSILSMAPHASGFTIQSEHLVALFITAGLLLHINGIQKGRWWFFLTAGISFGFAVLIKQSAVFAGIFAGIYILYYYISLRPVKWKLLIINTVMFTIGASGIVIFFIGLMYIKGSINDMIYWAFKFARNYVGEITYSQGYELLKAFFSRVAEGYVAFWITAVLGLVLVSLAGTDKSKKIYIWLLFIAGFLTVVPGLRFYGHYWQQFLPVVSLLIGLAFFSLNYFLSRAFKSEKVIYFTSAIFIILFINNLNINSSYYFTPNHTKILKTVYGENPFAEAKVVGDFIKEHSGSKDKIAVLGSEPEIYFYTGLESASRHIYITYLMADSVVFPEIKRLQEEFINDIEKEKPKYLVYIQNSISWLYNKKSLRLINNWFGKYANDNYSLIGVVDILGPDKTVYKWDKDALTYKPELKNTIGIFERKP